MVPRAAGGLFDAFPHVDPRQHAVHEAEVLQFMGTADAGALSAALRGVRDERWQPLLVERHDPGSSPRALLSIGVGDFRSTSAGAYRELVLAFPACEAGAALQLQCGSFALCQSRLPDCAHTYMFRSFVSQEAAVARTRGAGVDARLAEGFAFGPAEDKEQAVGPALSFSVWGPDGEEVFAGSVEVAPPGHAGGGKGADASSDVDVVEEPTAAPASEGYNLHPYVGTPGVLGPGQARYVCAFSAKVEVLPVRVAGALRAGPLLAQLRFQVEGALHLPNVSIMQLPPWGHEGQGPGPEAALQPPARPSPAQQPSVQPRREQATDAGVSPTQATSSDGAPGEGGDAPPAQNATASGTMPGGAAEVAPTGGADADALAGLGGDRAEPAGSQATPGAAGAMPQSLLSDLFEDRPLPQLPPKFRTAPASERRAAGADFPWHLSEL